MRVHHCAVMIILQAASVTSCFAENELWQETTIVQASQGSGCPNGKLQLLFMNITKYQNSSRKACTSSVTEPLSIAMMLMSTIQSILLAALRLKLIRGHVPAQLVEPGSKCMSQEALSTICISMTIWQLVLISMVWSITAACMHMRYSPNQSTIHVNTVLLHATACQ